MYLKYSDDIKLHSMSDLCTVNYVVTSSQVMVFKGDIMTKNM